MTKQEIFKIEVLLMVGCLPQGFSTCGPRTTGGPRPSAWGSVSKA